MTDSIPHSPRIAVIGAGISGLACAAALAEAGLAVQVFEKSRGVSGRMSTRRRDDWQCDHGAQYFTARDPAFRAEVQRWIAAGAATLWEPRMRVYAGPGTGDWTPHVSSVERFVGTPGMTAPGRLLARGLQVHTEVCITGLRREAAQWRLQSADGLIADAFDAVLLALPALQAQALLGDVAPALAAQAGSVTMRPAWALMLRFDTPLALPFDAAFVNAGPLRWVARDASKPGRGPHEVWLLHATPDWSAPRLEWPQEQVADVLQDAFVALGGARAEQWQVHRWRYADTERTLGEPCVWDLARGLGLCGDWLQEDKVQGAWGSGRALAAEVLTASAAPRVRRIDFGSADYAASLQLRETVLRVPLGLTLSAQDLQGEDAQWHFGLFDTAGALLACVVAVPLGAGGFKLRQMAVRADTQGQGLGSRLLAEVETRLQEQGATQLLLHARVSAEPFYARQGYRAESEVFEEVGIPHRRMGKTFRTPGRG